MTSLPSPKNGSQTLGTTPHWWRARYDAMPKPTSASPRIGSRSDQAEGS